MISWLTFFFVKMTVYVTGCSASAGWVSRNAILLFPTADKRDFVPYSGGDLLVFQVFFFD